ncbi:MAG: 3-deoxy-7-phosphoheptulonate synthase [Chloroflexi bacterium]|nr:3-deoxy-7-phosphoheptulonate synthase [Chloroflexota bacterium]
MLVVMQPGSSRAEIDAVMDRLGELSLVGHLSEGVERTVIGVVGRVFPELREMLGAMAGVEEVLRISSPFKLSSREFQRERSMVRVGDVAIGNGSLVVIAGPCSVESEDQVVQVARAVRRAGASMLRGGAFKPRTSPYSFRGLGEDGLRFLAQARAVTGLPVVTEVMTPGDIDVVARYADVLQVGARNMQNYQLLDAVGDVGMPVLLKRGISATIEEWLLAAEYVLARGNRQVILCERGIRTFETYTRNTLDLSAIPIVNRLSHLPVIADPSHGTGKWHLVPPMALAAVAAGADGLMIEVHPNPDHALSDGAQSLTPENFAALMARIGPVAQALGRRVAAQAVAV